MCQNLCVKREAGKSEIEKKQTVFLEVGQDRDYLAEFKVIMHFCMDQTTSKENQGQNSENIGKIFQSFLWTGS